MLRKHQTSDTSRTRTNRSLFNIIWTTAISMELRYKKMVFTKIMSTSMKSIFHTNVIGTISLGLLFIICVKSTTFWTVAQPIQVNRNSAELCLIFVQRVTNRAELRAQILAVDVQIDQLLTKTSSLGYQTAIDV